MPCSVATAVGNGPPPLPVSEQRRQHRARLPWNLRDVQRSAMAMRAQESSSAGRAMIGERDAAATGDKRTWEACCLAELSQRYRLQSGKRLLTVAARRGKGVWPLDTLKPPVDRRLQVPEAGEMPRARDESSRRERHVAVARRLWPPCSALFCC